MGDPVYNPEKVTADFHLRAVDAAKRKHPEIAPEALDAVADAYARHQAIFNQEYRELQAPTPHGAPPGRSWVNHEAGKLEAAHYNSVREDIIARYGQQQGDAAMRAFANETKPPSLLGGVLGQFFDGDKGGLQLGGILGGIAGIFAGKQLLEASGYSWLGWLGASFAFVAAAWAGNKTLDMIRGDQGHNEPTQARAPQPELQRRRKRETEAVSYAPMSEHVRQEARAAGGQAFQVEEAKLPPGRAASPAQGAEASLDR